MVQIVIIYKGDQKTSMAMSVCCKIPVKHDDIHQFLANYSKTKWSSTRNGLKISEKQPICKENAFREHGELFLKTTLTN